MKVSYKNSDPAFGLNNLGPDDMGAILLKIENAFNIRLEEADTHGVKNFATLCDAVAKKVKQKQSDACTTQHAFYMLRNAINDTMETDKDLIKPQTKLCNIFPRDTRLEVIAEIEQELGFKMNLLKPKGSVVFIFSMLLGASLALVYFLPVIGGIGAIISIAGLILAGKFGKEMPIKTLGELAEKISREHYLACRKNAATVNRAEIAEKLKEIFMHDLQLQPSIVNGSARF